MTRYLLDTSTVSLALRPRAGPRLASRLELRGASCALASMTLAELRYGARRCPDRERGLWLLDRVVELASAMPVVAFDAAAAEWLADERARLDASGTPVDLADLVIAATAAANDLTVVTRNLRHFGRLQVRAEDWSDDA